MSASFLTPPTHGRQRASAPGGSFARRRRTSALVGSALILTITACSGDAVSSPDPSSTTAPTAVVTPSPSDEQAQLLRQYRKFWGELTPVSRMPVAQRRVALMELAVDPALKSLLFGMAQADSKGQVFYGAAIPRPTARINPDDSTALVRDCQDGRQAGLAEKATGKRLTVGVARNHVSVTMKRQPGEQWKVAFIDYAKSPC